MKIALFGGSFNPVHNGHLKAAQKALKHTAINEVWFLPCHIHAFKKNGFVEEKERIEMLKLALKEKKRMKLSDFEIKLGKKTEKESRSLATTFAIRKKFPQHEFKWIIGSNLVKEMNKWEEFSKLIQETQFIVVPIKGSSSWRKENWLKKNKAIILPQKAAVENISSTKIRNRIKQGKTFVHLVPKKVFEHIAKKTLYLPIKGIRKKVLEATKKIPKGKISTYHEIAKAIGEPKASRAIGNALNKNPFAPIVPCHRVIKSNGEIGGFASGSKEKEKLLKSEGLSVKNHKIKNFDLLIVQTQKLRIRKSKN